MPNPTDAPVVTPTQMPTVAPAPEAWPDEYTSPIRICPDQSRRAASPDVAP